MGKIFQNLSNKILVAAPLKMQHTMFYQSIIYVLSHSQDGSIGLIINSPDEEMRLESVQENLGIETSDELCDDRQIPIYSGGPHNPTKGFVIHSSDYRENIIYNLPIDACISSNKKIIQDIANGIGPRESMLIMGHTVWRPREIEAEIEADLWLVLEPDRDLIFRNQSMELWKEAISMLGLHHSSFASKPASG